MLSWSHSAVQPMLPAKDLLLQVMPRTFIKFRILSLTCFQAAQGLAAAPLLYRQRSTLHQYRLQPKLRTVIVPKAAAAASSVPHFGQLGLCAELMQALAQQHINEPTEIQVWLQTAGQTGTMVTGDRHTPRAAKDRHAHRIAHWIGQDIGILPACGRSLVHTRRPATTCIKIRHSPRVPRCRCCGIRKRPRALPPAPSAPEPSSWDQPVS